MNIPNFIDAKIIDEEGRLSDIWRQILIQLFSELQLNASEEGIKVPIQDSATITSLNTSASTGAILYNSDTNKFMVCENGTFKTIQTI